MVGDHNHNLSYEGGAKTTAPKSKTINWIVKHDYKGKIIKLDSSGLILHRISPSGWQRKYSDGRYLVGSGQSGQTSKNFKLGENYSFSTADPKNPFTINSGGKHYHKVHGAHGGKGGGNPPMNGTTERNTGANGAHSPPFKEVTRRHVRFRQVNWIQRTEPYALTDGIDLLLPDGILSAWLTNDLPDRWSAKKIGKVATFKELTKMRSLLSYRQLIRGHSQFQKQENTFTHMQEEQTIQR